MKHLIFILLGLISACAILEKGRSTANQNLFTVAGDTVSVDEFIYAFQKNRPVDSAVTKAEVEEYLDLYQKFKLKVAEAKALGIDTTTEFRREYKTYLGQLQNSYLQTNNDTDSLVKQAFVRLQSQVNASHILLMIEPGALPEDTLKAYNKLLAIRDSIVNQGVDFGQMAMKYSQDPSAQQNRGDLGYFSVFQMVYPFENAAYATAVDEISLPARTRFGYHIVKVNNIRPNEGRVRVAHIMIRNAADAETKAFDLYNQLNAGADWDELCAANSEDFQSANRGGELAPFSRGQIVESFSDVAFGLSTPGEISEPVQTPYGWHIIKLIEKLTLSNFDKMRQQLEAQVQRDDRSKVSEQIMLERLAQENKLKENSDVIQVIIEPQNHRFDNARFNFTIDSLSKATVFTINSLPYTGDSLYRYISKAGNHQKTRAFLFEKYNEYRNEALITFEKSNLGAKYPEYNFLRKEYYDGILLFSIMEDLVWEPASTDSVGIENYYLANKDNYIDSTTVELAIFTSPEKARVDSIRRLFPDKERFINLSLTEKEALQTPKSDTAKVSLQLEFGEFEIAELERRTGKGNLTEPKISYVAGQWSYFLPLRLPGEARRMTTIRGRLIADYQEELEAEWLKEIAKKYPVRIDDKALKFVYKELEVH